QEVHRHWSASQLQCHGRPPLKSENYDDWKKSNFSGPRRNSRPLGVPPRTIGGRKASGGTDDVEVADLLVEGLDVDFEHSGRLGLVAGRRLKHALDILPLPLREGDERRRGVLRRRALYP